MKKILLDNKGQLFSIITVLMVLPLVFLSITFSETMSDYSGEIGSYMRLKSSYHYYYSLVDDLDRASEIIGERAILSAISRVVETGEGLNSSEETLEELFMDGTINGEHAPLMNRTSIDKWMSSVEDISQRRSYDLNLSVLDLEVEMYDPYSVSYNLDYSLLLRDFQNIFSLEKEHSEPKPVSIEGFEDPLITLGTGGRFYVAIKKCEFDYLTEKLVVGAGNNSWSVGETIILSSDEEVIGDIDDRDEKVLVVEEEVSEELMHDFSGAIIGENVDGLQIPYVSGIDLGEVPNETKVVVEGDVGEVWEIENLYTMWEDTCYFPAEGPDFLDRVEYELDTDSAQGLNVFLKKGELDAYGIDIKDRSNVAHVYFSDKDVTNCKVKGMPDSFLVDTDNLDKLDLDNTLSYGC